LLADIAPRDQVTVWLLDSEDPGANPNLDFVLADTADAVAELRAEGRRVLLHCVAAHQRTPSAAVAYARRLGIDAAEAQAAVRSAIPQARAHGVVWDAARGVSPR
jgi:protein-tyrosine phosphatase